jgi:hypothetical protein
LATQVTEGAPHPGQQDASEQQLLAEHGVEDPHGDEESEPVPRAVEQGLTGVR